MEILLILIAYFVIMVIIMGVMSALDCPEILSFLCAVFFPAVLIALPFVWIEHLIEMLTKKIIKKK